MKNFKNKFKKINCKNSVYIITDKVIFKKDAYEFCQKKLISIIMISDDHSFNMKSIQKAISYQVFEKAKKPKLTFNVDGSVNERSKWIKNNKVVLDKNTKKIDPLSK